MVKLLDKNVAFATMKERLKAIWKLEDGFDLMDITNGYYLVNLDMGKDQDKAINGRPWMLFFIST